MSVVDGRVFKPADCGTGERNRDKTIRAQKQHNQQRGRYINDTNWSTRHEDQMGGRDGGSRTHALTEIGRPRDADETSHTRLNFFIHARPNNHATTRCGNKKEIGWRRDTRRRVGVRGSVQQDANIDLGWKTMA
jgi:hypothetical protein